MVFDLSCNVRLVEKQKLYISKASQTGFDLLSPPLEVQIGVDLYTRNSFQRGKAAMYEHPDGWKLLVLKNVKGIT